ncbi:hypothetical protein G7Y79_00004g014810 [Physcia stellaris]|nr:hypothetical protein G7Y79_00004g014810 [Physcia stellaris]
MSLHGSQPFEISANFGNGLKLVAVGLTAYTLYGAIWRLYLSPVAHIPGPRFAALTFWNEFYYDVFLGGKYTWKLLEYHEKYGPIIRINPHEVHINDPEFYDEIYVGASKAKTDKWYWSMRMFGQQDVSAFDTLDHDKHRQRREPWSPFFSKQSVTRLQPLLIQKVVDKLCMRLAEYQSAGKPVVMTHAFACVTTDIISDYSFPEGYNLLDKPEFDSEHYEAWMTLSSFSHLLKQFGWLYPVLDAMPTWVTKYTSPEMYLVLQSQGVLLQQSIAISKQRDNPNYKETGRPSMMETFMNSPTLPESEKRPERIKAEAQIAIGAGTLTTAHALKAATYHILANPPIHEKLMAELITSIPDPGSPPTLRHLEQLPYLKAIMQETLRIYYGNSHRLQRIFPNQVVQYKDYAIPRAPLSACLQSTSTTTREFSLNPTNLILHVGKVRTHLSTNMFRRFGRDMELYNTVRARDIDTVYDVFNPLPSRQSNGLMVMFKKKEGSDVEEFDQYTSCTSSAKALVSASCIAPPKYFLFKYTGRASWVSVFSGGYDSETSPLVKLCHPGTGLLNMLWGATCVTTTSNTDFLSHFVRFAK